MARNLSIYKERNLPEEDVIQRAARSIMEFRNANSPTPSPANLNSAATYSIPKMPETRWRKPHLGLIKVNCDSNLQIHGWWGLGVICRDHEGLVMSAGAWKRQGNEEVIVAEALAMLFSLKLALDCGFRNHRL